MIVKRAVTDYAPSGEEQGQQHDHGAQEPAHRKLPLKDVFPVFDVVQRMIRLEERVAACRRDPQVG